MTPRAAAPEQLAIDAVPCLGGLIGMTSCPGVGEARYAGGAARDLAADIGVIRAWGADVLASLVEERELRALGVEALPQVARAAGLVWLHLPIRDMDVPDAAFERAWIAADLRGRLARGRSIVIHCRGGLGRTGLVAARLLVEAGAPSDAAIEAVRAARPGAIETAAQEGHVRGLAR